jgi:hypothetical protein
MNRQVLVRMRYGDSDRELARSRYMGRRKFAGLREHAEQRGWLKPDAALRGDAEIASRLIRESAFASARMSGRVRLPGHDRHLASCTSFPSHR